MMKLRTALALVALAACAGPPGKSSRIRLEPCSGSGVTVLAGLDQDDDGKLSDAEVESRAEVQCVRAPAAVDASAGCAGHTPCAAVGGYCADGRCRRPNEVECNRARTAPAREAGGPVLFDASQGVIGEGKNCKQDPANCPNMGNVCEFRFRFHDAEGDVATSPTELYRRILVFDQSRDGVPAFDVPDLDGDSVAVRFCLDEKRTTYGFAIQMEDLAGHRSNALCFEGTAP